MHVLEIIDSATEQLYFRCRKRSPPTWIAPSARLESRVSTRGRGRDCHTRSVPSTSGPLARTVQERERRPTASCGRASRASSTDVASAGGSAAPRRSRSYAGLADDFPFEEEYTPSTDLGGGGFGLLVREPVGVVGAIIPWNAPMPPHRQQDRARAAGGLHGRAKGRRPRPRARLPPRRGRRGDRPPAGRPQRRHRRPRGIRAAGARPARRQDHLHRLDRGRPSDRLDLRRADRPLHARARRQVGGGDPRRHRHRTPRPRRWPAPSAS